MLHKGCNAVSWRPSHTLLMDVLVQKPHRLSYINDSCLGTPKPAVFHAGEILESKT